MPSTTSIYDPAVLAPFIGNVLAGWLVLIVIGGALLVVVAAGAWSLGRSSRRAPKHTPAAGRRQFDVGPNPKRRLAQHCGVTAAAETALLPAIAPVYLGPPIETTQRLPHVQPQRATVTTGGAR